MFGGEDFDVWGGTGGSFPPVPPLNVDIKALSRSKFKYQDVKLEQIQISRR